MSCLVLGWRQAEASSRSWGARLSTKKTEALWCSVGNFVQSKILSALHQNGLRKASVLGGKHKSAAEVNNFFFPERKNLIPGTRALEQHGCAVGGGTQVVGCSPAHRNSAHPMVQGAGGWLVWCHQQSRRVPRTFLLVRRSFHCICVPTSAVWAHNAACTRNFSGWFYLHKIFRSKELLMFGQKNFRYFSTCEGLEALVLAPI